jgi:hypothetical protein
MDFAMRFPANIQKINPLSSRIEVIVNCPSMGKAIAQWLSNQ